MSYWKWIMCETHTIDTHQTCVRSYFIGSLALLVDSFATFQGQIVRLADFTCSYTFLSKRNQEEEEEEGEQKTTFQNEHMKNTCWSYSIALSFRQFLLKKTTTTKRWYLESFKFQFKMNAHYFSKLHRIHLRLFVNDFYGNENTYILCTVLCYSLISHFILAFVHYIYDENEKECVCVTIDNVQMQNNNEPWFQYALPLFNFFLSYVKQIFLNRFPIFFPLLNREQLSEYDSEFLLKEYFYLFSIQMKNKSHEFLLPQKHSYFEHYY